MTQLKPSAPLSRETFDLIASGQVPDVELHDFFHAHPEEPVLDAWLLSTLHPLTPASQLRLRIARQALTYWQGNDGRQYLLFGVPLSLVTTGEASAWEALRVEYEAGLTHALLETHAKVRMFSIPVSPAVVHTVGPSRLGSCCELLMMGRDPVEELHTKLTPGPGVWAGLVSVPVEHKERLQQLFFQVNPELSKLVSSLTVRLESLAEAKGIKVRMFPPSAYWNSPSLARMVDARLKIQPLKKTGQPFTAERRGRAVVLQCEGDDVFEFDFPEELDSDIAPLFAGWAEFKVSQPSAWSAASPDA